MVRSPLWLNLAVVLIFMFLGFCECKRLRARYPGLDLKTVHRRAPYLFVLVFFLALSLAANLIVFADQDLLWKVPPWLSYAFNPLTFALLLAIFSFVFSLTSTLSFQTGHPERWKLLVPEVMLLAAMQIFHWNWTRPLAPELKQMVSPHGVVMQSSMSSCAAASAANLLKTFGIEKTEKEMAALFGTTEAGGTSAAQIIYGMKKLGFSCRKVETGSNPDALKPPAMLFCGGHAVAYMRLRRDKPEIWEPGFGRQYLWSKGRITNIRAVEFRR